MFFAFGCGGGVLFPPTSTAAAASSSSNRGRPILTLQSMMAGEQREKIPH